MRKAVRLAVLTGLVYTAAAYLSFIC